VVFNKLKKSKSNIWIIFNRNKDSDHTFKKNILYTCVVYDQTYSLHQQIESDVLESCNFFWRFIYYYTCCLRAPWAAPQGLTRTEVRRTSVWAYRHRTCKSHPRCYNGPRACQVLHCHLHHRIATARDGSPGGCPRVRGRNVPSWSWPLGLSTVTIIYASALWLDMIMYKIFLYIFYT